MTIAKNDILVCSQITRSFPYYKAISKQLDDDSTIDKWRLESSSYSEQSIADAKKVEKKRLSPEKQEGHSEEASQGQNPEGEFFGE